MKRFMNLFTITFVIVFCQYVIVYGDTCNTEGNPSTVVSTNNVTSLNNQTMQGQGYGYGYSYSQSGNSYAEGGDSIAQGGDSVSDSDSIAYSEGSDSIAFISTNSTSNYESRTPPISMLPPYLPTYPHGGWGTIQGYFPNGPTSNNSIYERAFFPDSKHDMKEIKSVMNSLSYDGPLSLIGGILNGIGTIFGGPDNFHHGKGFEIANSIVRKRRPKNRPLYILIDSNINQDYLKNTGYTYVGKVSLEGKTKRNWDQVYKAAIAEVLPWDVDIMLVSGGMKGVTVGSTTTFPSAAGAYAQTNYSVTLLGGRSTGITEGKGEAVVSGECYRYNPRAVRRKRIPEQFYNRIHTNVAVSRTTEKTPQVQNNMQPAPTGVSLQSKTPVKAQDPVKQDQYYGIKVSQELYNMAGFNAQ